MKISLAWAKVPGLVALLCLLFLEVVATGQQEHHGTSDPGFWAVVMRDWWVVPAWVLAWLGVDLLEGLVKVWKIPDPPKPERPLEHLTDEQLHRLRRQAACVLSELEQGARENLARQSTHWRPPQQSDQSRSASSQRT